MRLRRVLKIACSEIRRKIETSTAVITSNEFLELVEKRDKEMKRKRDHQKSKKYGKKIQKVDEQDVDKQDIMESFDENSRDDQINKKYSTR
ncbi:hypothetical protein AVEN_251919-1 [Araneus ventricosus]|uniref:Uncharacterized protein n=1 Tax=Araneus ventricosus TaxID=182803 RepID=A0A4Y2GY09_ARAVE|nr:hypothetical protein AVEN_251919-1 [Araneus ventricosus]